MPSRLPTVGTVGYKYGVSVADWERRSFKTTCKACNTLYKVNKVYSVTDEPLKQPFILLHFDSDRF